MATFSKNSFVFTISTNVCLQLWSKWTNYLLSGTSKSSLWRWKINKIWTIMNLLNSRLVKCSFLCFIYLLKKTKKFWIKIKLCFKNQNKTWSWFNALSATNFYNFGNIIFLTHIETDLVWIVGDRFTNYECGCIGTWNHTLMWYRAESWVWVLFWLF